LFDQGVPKKIPTTTPSSQSECHLTVFYIDHIVPGFVVYFLNRLMNIQCLRDLPERYEKKWLI
jgi:hypothetical protein